MSGYTRQLWAKWEKVGSEQGSARDWLTSQAANCKHWLLQIVQPPDEARRKLQLVLRPPSLKGFVGLKIWRPS